jgi:hypothetical protein
MREKKHFFRMKAAFAALLTAALMAGCEHSGSDSGSDPGTDTQERGSLRVSLDFVAGTPAPAEHVSRTVYPALEGFTRYEVSFEATSGGAAHDPVELSNGTATVTDLVVGTYTITGTAFTGTAPNFTAVALGTKPGATPGTASITMGPKTGTGNGTFGYAITLPAGVANGELKLLADGDGGAQVGNTVTLTAGQVTTGSIPAPAGYYRVHITLTDSNKGLVEVVHIYGGLTSTLTKVYGDEDFTPPEAVSTFDLSGFFPAPATGATPVPSLDGTQYSGTIEWSPSVSGAFAATTAYTATVTLTAKAGYTFTGVESSDFFHGSVHGTGTTGSGVLTLVFGSTGGVPETGSLNVSIGFGYGNITVTGGGGTIYKGGTPSSLVFEVIGYEDIAWYVDGSTTGLTENPLTLLASGYTEGNHSVTFTGRKGGIPYSQPVSFTVEATGGGGIDLGTPEGLAEYLTGFPDGAPEDNPVTVAFPGTFNTATADWTGFRNAVENTPKWTYILLDLSAVSFEDNAIPEGDTGSSSNTLWAFVKQNTFITEVILPATITIIKDSAFYNATGLKSSMTIPASVLTIENWAFYGCAFSTVIFEGGGVTITNDTSFASGASLRTAYSEGGVGTYTRSATTWTKQ